MYGMQGLCLDCFISSSNTTKQFVRKEGAECQILTICCGVSHGSIIGPFLFIISNNDISNSSKDPSKCPLAQSELL